MELKWEYSIMWYYVLIFWYNELCDSVCIVLSNLIISNKNINNLKQ